ncbi:MAG: hypothetical protein GOMPHAMPRED_001243 [Gomphillus americanus]|uniref:Major facilitator superfamily (MFS) profile domain-containing protein n=1 Tax=Gomphillus americanus TaxID=1940652 RepID=A0A8H3F5G3_9LECA|nr:MAG: hypothetical protein GOMPHAMPRED_001243 [Gomphillus americanus]
MDAEQERLLDNELGEQIFDVSIFAEQYGLASRLEVLRKAAFLVQKDATVDQVPGLTKQEKAALHAEISHKWRQPLTMYLCIAATALGAMGQGWAQTGINGANLYYPKQFGIGSDILPDTLIVGFINSAIYLSNALIGSWLVAPLNDKYGRTGAVAIGTVISLVFNIAGSMAGNWQTLLLSRLVLGIGLAVVSGTLNIFAAESAPASIRGGLGVAWQMSCAFGIFLAFFTNMQIDSQPKTYGESGWRIMLLTAALPTLPLLVLIFICPESPSWYIKQSKRYDCTYRSLCRLRNTEIQAAKETIRLYLQSKTLEHPSKPRHVFGPLTELFTNPRIYRATLAAYTTMLSQQLCGINTVAFYSSTLFVEAKFSAHAAELASTIFGLVNFIGAVPAIWLMDLTGRRTLLLITLLPMSMVMEIAAMSFSLPESSTTLRFGLSTSMIYLFCFLYSFGMGPIPACYSAEVFPLSHRELGMSSATAVTNVFAAVLSLTFPWLLSVLGTTGSFMLYGLLNVVAWVLVFLFVPETKQRTLEELDEVFSVPTNDFIRREVSRSTTWMKRHVLRR